MAFKRKCSLTLTLVIKETACVGLVRQAELRRLTESQQIVNPEICILAVGEE